MACMVSLVLERSMYLQCIMHSLRVLTQSVFINHCIVIILNVSIIKCDRPPVRGEGPGAVWTIVCIEQ